MPRYIVTSTRTTYYIVNASNEEQAEEYADGEEQEEDGYPVVTVRVMPE